jgi:hypothetical protein
VNLPFAHRALEVILALPAPRAVGRDHDVECLVAHVEPDRRAAERHLEVDVPPCELPRRRVPEEVERVRSRERGQVEAVPVAPDGVLERPVDVAEVGDVVQRPPGEAFPRVPGAR